jgi:hypothetical protein
VNRQGLYDTCGGKDQLFLAALERYREIQAWPLWIREFFCPM